MTFQIKKVFKPDQIKSRNLDTKILGMYYKTLQQLLIEKTSVEQTTDYFFCEDYALDKHLFIAGMPTAGHKKVFKGAAKGEEGFDKSKVSIGSCFVLNEDGKNILCLYPNITLSKGKKKTVLTTLRKIQRSSWKQIKEVRWLMSPLVVDAQDESKVESAAGASEPGTTGTGTTKTGTAGAGETPKVSKEDVISKAKELKRGIKKLVKDVMPRYKKRETTENDAAFVKALRKAGHLFLAQLPLTDAKTREQFSSQKKTLESGLPQWKELESRIHSQTDKVASNAALKKSLLEVVEKMKASRSEIKTILKRVNLKTLS